MGGGTYHGPVIQGGDVHIHLSPGAPATPGAPGGPDPWTDAADRSAVWGHVPAGRDATAGVFDGWAGFRTDERKVRELLMGVQLYKDRDLAVRELYQNALDACRYRRARTEYLDRTGPASWAYEGRITFEQGVDEHGRAYVECRDNGIGMGDAELRGVFSQAGARFAEQPEFKLERAAWNRLDPPVELYPNSRFGIGVLSYFMLADELTVTTCRMGPDGRPGPVLEVAIHGPGHLFRIVQRAPRGEGSGTVVRLHLRDSVTAEAGWSCVDVLERVLGVAEFGTTAVHGARRAQWQAGQLQVRQQPDRERFGFDAHGSRVDWADAPKGVRVTWTEHGGALLVDGLMVQPAVRRGVLSTEGAGLSGVVVDLSGPYAPAQLSADRAEVLDDVSSVLLELLAPAAEALVAGANELPTYGWVCRIADGSPQLADLLAAAATRAGLTLELGGRSFPTARTGVFPADMQLLSMHSAETSQRIDPWAVTGYPPDHVFLWRLPANAPHPLLDELTAFCPELRNDAPVLVAMPSDQLLLSENRTSDYWSWHEDGSWSGAHLAGAVERWGVKLRDAARRAAGLGLHGARPEGLPERLPLPAVVEPTLRRAPGGFPGRVTVTDLVRAVGDDRRRLREVADTWRGLGITVPEGVVPLARKAMADELLRRDGDNPRYGWFTVGETVPAGRIAQAGVQRGISVTEACALFAGYGLAADPAGRAAPRPGRAVFVVGGSHRRSDAVRPPVGGGTIHLSPTEHPAGAVRPLRSSGLLPGGPGGTHRGHGAGASGHSVPGRRLPVEDVLGDAGDVARTGRPDAGPRPADRRLAHRAGHPGA